MATPKVTFNEKTSGTISGTIVDELGAGINGALLDTLFLTIYKRGDPSQRVRSSVDMLADPRFTIDAVGAFVWTIRAEDTQILDDELAVGSNEIHTVYLEFSWNAADSGNLTDPFAVTSGSKTITVSHTAHGLDVGDHAVFRNTENVGGLDLDGVYVVKTKTVNSYTIEHQTAATSTDASGGGPVEYFYNGKTSSDELLIVTKHVDPT